MIDSPRITEAARSGEGVGWHEHDHDVYDGCERFFRPGYNANLIPAWLPALDGVVEKLQAGAKVADIGCGHGVLDDPDGAGVPELDVRRLRLSRGLDRDRPPTGAGRRRRRSRALRDGRCRPRITAAGYDLVTMFDCLHDMGDPVGAARHVHRTLAPDGTWMIVEPMAGDRVEDNLNPVGRAYYGFSTFLCTPASLSQEVGLALGAQAGEARIGDVVTGGRLHTLPARGRDALQPRLRGAAVNITTTPAPHASGGVGRSRRRAESRPLPRCGGLRRARRYAALLRGLRRGRGDPLPDPDLVAGPLPPLEDADPLLRAPLPGADDGRPRQRALRSLP